MSQKFNSSVTNQAASMPHIYICSLKDAVLADVIGGSLRLSLGRHGYGRYAIISIDPLKPGRLRIYSRLSVLLARTCRSTCPRGLSYFGESRMWEETFRSYQAGMELAVNSQELLELQQFALQVQTLSQSSLSLSLPEARYCLARDIWHSTENFLFPWGGVAMVEKMGKEEYGELAVDFQERRRLSILEIWRESVAADIWEFVPTARELRLWQLNRKAAIKGNKIPKNLPDPLPRMYIINGQTKVEG